MKKTVRIIFTIPLIVSLLSCGRTDNKTIRAAVIGGMTMTGLWENITTMFAEDTGYEVCVVITGQRSGLADAIRRGEVDFLTMHSGDITTNIVADGYGTDMLPWAKNDLVIAGHVSDPAGIDGLRDGVEAFTRIARHRANFIDSASIGPREMSHTLWKRAGITPTGSWYMQDRHRGHDNVLKFASRNRAYIVFGRMPLIWGKIPFPHDMRILVQGDPLMRRPYIAMAANPEKVKGVNIRGAKMLLEYLLSDRVQEFLASYDGGMKDGIPLFYPVNEKYAAKFR